ncbi:MAG: hypothetical protein CK425_12345 [Parachlamydia sp.]|nr:MAG: hypothetical protein CK425_12345 [Parachlamydia sp.]
MIKPVDKLNNFQLTPSTSSTKTAKAGKTPQGLTVKQASKVTWGNAIANLFQRLQLVFGEKTGWNSKKTIEKKIYNLSEAQIKELNELFDEANKDIFYRTDIKVRKFQETIFLPTIYKRAVDKFLSNISDPSIKKLFKERIAREHAMPERLLGPGSSVEWDRGFYSRFVTLAQAGLNSAEFFKLATGEELPLSPDKGKIKSVVKFIISTLPQEEFDKIIEDHAKAKAAQ